MRRDSSGNVGLRRLYTLFRWQTKEHIEVKAFQN